MVVKVGPSYVTYIPSSLPSNSNKIDQVRNFSKKGKLVAILFRKSLRLVKNSNGSMTQICHMSQVVVEWDKSFINTWQPVVVPGTKAVKLLVGYM